MKTNGRPDFFVIGAMKAGTTSLHHYLRAHPDLYLPPDKEAPFFSYDGYFDRGFDWYLKEFFTGARRDQRWGTVSPLYMADPRVPERMRALCPDVRLIALLRNPVERARSHYRMMVRAFGERRSFEELITAQFEPESLEWLRAPPEADGAEHRKVDVSISKYQQAYVVRGEYGRVLAGYLRHFPRERLLCLYSHDLSADPAGVLERICRFLEIDGRRLPPPEKRYHVAAGAGSKPWLRTVANTVRTRPPWLSPLAKALIPKRYRRRLALWSIMHRNLAPASGNIAVGLTAETERRLARHFLGDLETLEAIVGGQVPWRARLMETAAARPEALE